MIFRTIIFLMALTMNLGYPTTSDKTIAPKYYAPDGVTTMNAIQVNKTAGAKVGGTTHRANDTLISYLQFPTSATTANYNFDTYADTVHVDSVKVYINSVLVYKYHYHTTAIHNHSINFKAKSFSNSVKFVTVYKLSLIHI